MKVLDVSDFYSERGGGISCHLGLKSRALVELGVDHRVVVPGSRDEVRVLHRAIVEGRLCTAELLRVRGAAQPYDPSYHFLTRLTQVAQTLRREQPDVIELNSPYLAALGVRWAGSQVGGVRTFFWHSNHVGTWVTSPLTKVVPEPVAEGIASPLWWMLRRLLNSCDAVITTTRWQTRDLEAHGVRNVHLIPFGVDNATFHPGRRSTERRQELLGAGRDGAQLFVAVGRLSMEKRFDVVIDAFLRYHETRDARLIVFGDGPERESLERRAASCPDVHFAGFELDRVRLASAFASADALLHGCPHETFGLAVAEALSCGLPAVVPDAGGALENAVGPSSEVYPSGDPVACAQALVRLMQRPHVSLQAAASEHAKTIRAQEEHFREVVALYRQILARGARSPRSSPLAETFGKTGVV